MLKSNILAVILSTSDFCMQGQNILKPMLLELILSICKPKHENSKSPGAHDADSWGRGGKMLKSEFLEFTLPTSDAQAGKL